MTFDFKHVPHTEAIARIAKMPTVAREVYDELLPEMKAMVFTVKGVALARDREAIRDIIAAVPGGETYEAARRKVIAVLKANDFNDKAAARRAELLLQHWTGVAYSTARYRVAMQDPEAFPWWQYLTMGDKRVRAAHSALDGKIFRYDSPVWQKILPPWEPGCRCSWRELNDFQVEDIRAADAKLEPAQRRFMEGAMLERAEKGELITATKLVELKNGVPVKTSWAPVQPYSLEPRPGWIGWNPENMVPSPEFLQKALKPESYAELMTWAATRKVDGGATVKEWIEGLPQAQRSAAKAAKKVKPAAPRPSAPGVPGPAALPPVEPASADPAKQVAAHVHSGKAPAKVKEAIAEAGRAIAEVQSDGGLLQTEVAARPPGDHYGYYDREQPPAGFGSSMAVSEDCPVIVNDALHECGHKIEEEAIIHHDTPLNAEAAAQRKAIVAALLDTPTAQAIKAGDADDRDYLLDPSEVFARAFAQWVTTRSSSALAKKELADILAGKHTAAGVPPVWQWQADEFFKAIVLFDNLMRALRWSK